MPASRTAPTPPASTPPAPTFSAAARRAGPAVVVVLAGALALGACGPSSTDAAPAGPPTSSAPAPDPAVKPYCDAVAAVQAEQSAPQAGTGGVAASSADTRRQIASLVATAPPEIAGDWRVLQGLTDQSLDMLAATGGDPRRIDQGALDAISRQSQPTVAHIKAVTQKRCGIAFAGAGPAPAAAPPPSSTTPTRTSSSSKKTRTTTTPRTTSSADG